MILQHSGAPRRGIAKLRLQTTSGRHRPPPGRRNAPPDDRLHRAIQYSETSVIERTSCGVLDTPHARGYDGVVPSEATK
jgi:hypothetical protein